jgi:catalase
MVHSSILFAAAAAALINVSSAVCPYMAGDARDLPAHHPPVRRQDTPRTNEFMSQYEIDDSDVYMSSDVGGPMADQESLSVGERGPTLLEDFIFRQKVGYLF